MRPGGAATSPRASVSSPTRSCFCALRRRPRVRRRRPRKRSSRTSRCWGPWLGARSAGCARARHVACPRRAAGWRLGSPARRVPISRCCSTRSGRSNCMLDQPTRTAVLRLREAGHGTRAIARALGISRGTVKEIGKGGREEVPLISRTEKAESHEPLVRELFTGCKGNLVRVHEELQAKGIELSYPALTGFCRRHKIGGKAKVPSGHYHFEPAEEMQPDTSPHEASIGGAKRLVQTAVLVLWYSGMLFFQAYLSFTRFFCKLFLTDALQYLGGSCTRCMIDNTHVVVLSGTGAEMAPVPEMAAFADRFGFAFAAHEKGDANRSARVERPMDYLERNFYAGRKFTDLADLNAQAVAFCDKSNARWRRHLHASPRELFAAERPHLKRLPIHVPEVYLLHPRIAGVEGHVRAARHRYSVPPELIRRGVEVR